MDQRVPLAVRELAEAYVEGLEKNLPGQIVGVYLHGSAALGAFDAQSDVDFLVILNRKLTCEELVQLTDLHGELTDVYPFIIMEGSYVTNEDLGHSVSAPYFDGFMMTPAGNGVVNPIMWRFIKEHGICLKGRPPEELAFHISDTELVDYVYQTMNTYWRQRVKRMAKAATQANSFALPFDLDFEIEWTVLGILRQVYTLKKHRMTSKLGAGQYGIDTLPEAYHPIIEEAIRIRKRKEKSAFYSTKEKLHDTFQLIDYLFNIAEIMSV